MSQQKPFSVAIIGGGIVGVVLTIGLRRRNINVRIYERGDKLGEVGAGLGMNSSAAAALELLGPEAFAAFKECATAPVDPSIAADFRDGMTSPQDGGWTIPWDGVAAGVHRAEFMNALLKHVPEEVIEFGKTLEDIEEREGSPLKLIFKDGTTATANAVIGADGIGSHVRRWLVGSAHPSVRARYSHEYVYRAMLNMSDARALIEPKLTEHITCWMGQNAHVMAVPISHGEILALAAVVRDPAMWPSEHKLTLPADKKDVEAVFADWSSEVRALIGGIPEGKIDRWALFDLAENPVPFYARGAVAIAGDAAHATTPFLGSGAGTGIEDAAVLAELLADEHMQGTPEQFAAAFAAYNEVRLPRGHWLTKNSRRTGDLEDYAVPEVKSDLEKIKKEVNEIYKVAWSNPVHDHIKRAKEGFVARLSQGQDA